MSIFAISNTLFCRDAFRAFVCQDNLEMIQSLLSKNPELMLADVLNQGEALFESGSAAVIELVLDKCMSYSSPGRPFGGLKLQRPSGETLLQHCIEKNIASPSIARMMKHQERCALILQEFAIDDIIILLQRRFLGICK